MHSDPDPSLANPRLTGILAMFGSSAPDTGMDSGAVYRLYLVSISSRSAEDIPADVE